MAGFERGRNLDKVGMHAQDTSELFFSDVRVPAGNLLGEEGGGFVALMQNLPRERVAIGATALAGAEAVFEHDAGVLQAAAGVRPADRQVPAQPVRPRRDGDRARRGPGVHRPGGASSTTRASCRIEDAAMVKWWNTELCNRVVDRCVQLHGGYGYMREYPVARAFADGRVQTIFGGTTEIMKEIIGRGLGRLTTATGRYDGLPQI